MKTIQALLRIIHLPKTERIVEEQVSGWLEKEKKERTKEHLEIHFVNLLLDNFFIR